MTEQKKKYSLSGWFRKKRATASRNSKATISIEVTKRQKGSTILTARSGRYDGNSVIIPDFPVEAAYFNAAIVKEKKNKKSRQHNPA